jgi:tetratricopeptide (TPR) repeat protein
MAKAWDNLGATLLTLGDHHGAIEACERAATLDPGRIAAHCNGARALYQAGRLEEAVAACRAVLARRPRHADAQGLLGRILMQLGRPREALPALQARARLAPGDEAQAELSACLAAQAT